jgi:prophage regulatory protein
MFARLPTVMQATGLGRSTIYRLMAYGAFPAPVHLGPRAVGWRWSDLDQWSESRQGDASTSSIRAARWVKGGRGPAPANP